MKTTVYLTLGVLVIIVFVIGVAMVGSAFSPTTTQQNTATIVPVTGSDPLVTVVPDGIAGGAPQVLDTDPVRGSSNPTVTIIEFGDFQCETCARMHTIMSEIVKNYGSDVQHVWKDFPLPDQHQYAVDAANAARCAAEQGLFWEYHDALLDNQVSIGLQPYEDFGTAFGLETEAFTSCLTNTTYNREVLQGYFAARSLQLETVPTYYINEQKIEGERTYDEIATLVEQARNQ